MDKFNEYLKANRGQAVRLAEFLDLSPSTISQWHSVPIKHAPKVCQFTGLSLFDLYPELKAKPLAANEGIGATE